MPDKEQLQKEIDSMMRSRKIFLFIAIGFFVISLALFITSVVFGLRDINSEEYYLTAYLSGIALMIGLTMMILRSALFNFRINVRRAIINGNIKVEQDGRFVQTVDVKPVPEEKPLSKEEELYKQYEELYKAGHITKEDLDKKKEELLK